MAVKRQYNMTENRSATIRHENTVRRKPESVRWQIDLPKIQSERCDALLVTCQLDTRKELFNNAMTLFAWAVSEVQKGNMIGSFNPEDKAFSQLLMAPLDAAASQRAKEGA